MSDTYNYDSSTRKTTGPKTTVHVGKSSLPAELTHTKEPSYVTINADGTFAFLYIHNVSASSTFGSASAGTVAGGEYTLYETGSIVTNAAAGPIKLDIQPRAWRRTDAGSTLGDVTFVYKGGN